MRVQWNEAAVALALGGLVSGCAWNQEARSERSLGTSHETRVEVSSMHWDDVRVYAVSNNGGRVRLGMVGSMETRTFTLPADILSSGGSVRLIANPVAGPTAHHTGHILLRPGDLVKWLIENPLALSSYVVRSGMR